SSRMAKTEQFADFLLPRVKCEERDLVKRIKKQRYSEMPEVRGLDVTCAEDCRDLRGQRPVGIDTRDRSLKNIRVIRYVFQFKGGGKFILEKIRRKENVVALK